MQPATVALVRYDSPAPSLRRVVELAGGLPPGRRDMRVFIKPNIVFWTRAAVFPKWGVITTSRVVEEMVVLLKEHGFEHITIGEGIVTADPTDRETPAHAFASLGYEQLQKRYGVHLVNIFERPFQAADLGDGIRLRFNRDILQSDLVVDLPVLKSHNQTVVSLGIKNLKGTLDLASRKKCHSARSDQDLHAHVSRLADAMPPIFTLIDGIFSLERGPGPDGKMHRTNLLIASHDILAADTVGARVLGYTPDQVPHLAHAATRRGWPLDLSPIQTRGEAIEAVARLHRCDFPYQETEDVCLPAPMVRQGLRGIYYRKFDTTMCTYCSGINGLVLSAIRQAWKGEAFDRVEVLTGKKMQPTAGMNKTILLGKCIYQAHRDNPLINELIAVKGCPPKAEEILGALQRAGIDADPQLFEARERLPGLLMDRYAKRPEFDEAFFRVP
jgi:uncharacterized protein (DUF362 family)